MSAERVFPTRDYEAAELEEMLAAMPRRPPCFCGTGIRWLQFLGEAPHTPATLGALRQLLVQREDLWKDLWKTHQVLGALSRNIAPDLRSLWLDLLGDVSTPPEWLPTIIHGLGRVGTEADLLALLPRLGTNYTVDQAFLQVAAERQLAGARGAALARYEARVQYGDERITRVLRWQAARTLLRLEGPGWEAALRQGLRDPDPVIREDATRALAGRPDSLSAPLLRQQLVDPEPAIRWQAARLLEQLAPDEGLPLLLQALRDPHVLTHRAAEETLLRRFGQPGLRIPGPYQEAILVLAEAPDSPVSLSAGLLYQAGLAAEQQGQFARAEAFYCRSWDAGKRWQHDQLPINQDPWASAGYRLARLLYLLGRETEAIQAADALGGLGYRHVRLEDDAPHSPGITNNRCDGLGPELARAFREAPLRLRVEPLAPEYAAGELLRAQLQLANRSAEPQRLILYPSPHGGYLPGRDWELSCVLYHSAWLSHLPGELPCPEERSLRPGESVAGIVEKLPYRGPQRGPTRLDVLCTVTCRSASGKEWRGQLAAIATVRVRGA